MTLWGNSTKKFLALISFLALLFSATSGSVWALDTDADESDDENKTELQKIYIRRYKYDNEFLNGGSEKITLYNNG